MSGIGAYLLEDCSTSDSCWINSDTVVLLRLDSGALKPSPTMPLLAVPHVTAHPSTASVQITVLQYNGPLLCGFNVGIKGLKMQRVRDCDWYVSLSTAKFPVFSAPSVSSFF